MWAYYYYGYYTYYYYKKLSSVKLDKKGLTTLRCFRLVHFPPLYLTLQQVTFQIINIYTGVNYIASRVHLQHMIEIKYILQILNLKQVCFLESTPLCFNDATTVFTHIPTKSLVSLSKCVEQQFNNPVIIA